MAEYQLYCFAQSGNAYRAALMLNLIHGSDNAHVSPPLFAAESRVVIGLVTLC